MNYLKIKIYNLLFLLTIISFATANGIYQKPQVLSSTTAIINWTLPRHYYTGFQLKLKQYEDNNFTLIGTFNISYNINSFEIKNLFPGDMYSIQLFTINNNKIITNCLTQYIVIRPNPPVDLIVTNISETSVWISYKPPSTGIFNYYQIIIDPPNNKNQSVFNFLYTKMKIDNLYSSTTYKITVQTVSFNDVTSNKMFIQFTTLPSSSSSSSMIKNYQAPIVDTSTSPFNIKFKKSLTSNNFTLSWDRLDLEYYFDHYELVISASCFLQKSVINKSVTWWEVRDLDLNIKYYFIFKTINQGIKTQFIDGFFTLFNHYFVVDINGKQTLYF